MTYAGLPFVKKTKRRVSFWSAKPTGDGGHDFVLGQEYALLTLQRMAAEPWSYDLISRIAEDMADSRADDIKLGFWSTMRLYLNESFLRSGPQLLRLEQDETALAMARYERQQVIAAVHVA